MHKIRLSETLASPAARKANKDNLRELLWATGEFESMRDVDYYVAKDALLNNDAPPTRSRR